MRCVLVQGSAGGRDTCCCTLWGAAGVRKGILFSCMLGAAAALS